MSAVIALYLPNLYFRPKVELKVKEWGYEPVQIQIDTELLPENTRLVLFDFNRPDEAKFGLFARLARPDVSFVAFGSHEDVATFAWVKAHGGRMTANSSLFKLLAKELAPIH